MKCLARFLIENVNRIERKDKYREYGYKSPSASNHSVLKYKLSIIFNRYVSFCAELFSTAIRLCFGK